MRRFIFFVLVSVAVFATTIFFRLGGHKDVQIEQADYPELRVIFKEHVGPYHKINEIIVSVEQWAQSLNLPCPRTFGEYLDDPRLVDERRLRSYGGCVVTTEPELSEGVLYKVIPARQAVVARFEGAPSIGPLKVYPAVEEWMQQKGLKIAGPVIEIYTIKGQNEAVTEYIFPL